MLGEHEGTFPREPSRPDNQSSHPHGSARNADAEVDVQELRSPYRLPTQEILLRMSCAERSIMPDSMKIRIRCAKGPQALASTR